MNNSYCNDKKQKYKDSILYRKREIKKIKNPKPSIFLDRDGVIIEDCHYIKNHENVKLCPGVKDFIRYLHNQKHKIIIITNQSGISRGYFKEKNVYLINEFIQEKLDPNREVIKDWFFCPHSPEDNCLCRKPKTGLFNEICKKYNFRKEFYCPENFDLKLH